jgi:hypothetical protein
VKQPAAAIVKKREKNHFSIFFSGKRRTFAKKDEKRVSAEKFPFALYKRGYSSVILK